MNGLILWLAQGGGVGRTRFAPGTLGSLLGLLWFALLLVAANEWVFIGGALLGVALSVWICGAAEKILRETDPPSVVLDEIVAVPLCFLAWSIREWLHRGDWPSLTVFFGSQTGWGILAVFVAFRVFDVLKPWPVRTSQRWPGGWGVTADDVLAAGYVNLATLIYFGLFG